MQIKKIFFCALAFNLFFTAAYGASFSKFVFFGDSLSDIGNNPHAPYGTTPNWTTDFTAKYGQNTSSSSKGGDNFAYGGAQSDGANGLQEQVNQALSHYSNNLDSHALYSILIGGNDVFNKLLTTDIDEIARVGSDNVSDAVKTLHNHGAKYILLGNVPDVGLSPAIKDSPILELYGSIAAAAFNDQTRQKINQLGYDVIQVDTFHLIDYMVSHKSEFGFVHTSDAMCKNLASCEGYLFYDEKHPTAEGYRIIADYDYSILEASGFFANLAEEPFNVIKSQDSAIKTQLFEQFVLNGLDTQNVFASGNITPYAKTPYNSDRPDNKYYSGGGTLGLYFPLNKNFILGGAYGFNQANTSLGSAYSYDTTINMVSLFSNYHYDQFYLNGIANFSYLNFSNIERTAPLGKTSIVTNGNTDGFMYGFGLDSGYLFNVPETQWKTGPIINANIAQIKVHGYTETGASDSDFEKIVYNNQTNESLDTGLGWQAMFEHPFNGNIFTTHIYVTGNHQWLERDREIGFHVLSIAGSHGSLPAASMATPYYVDGGVNVGWTFKNGWSTTLGYNGAYGSKNMRNNSINIGISKNL